MKKILFPTDFSNNADHALKYAINLCQLLKAELIILHSCRVEAFAYQLMEDETNEDLIIEKAKEELDKYCKNHAGEFDKIKVSTVVEYGLAVDSIVKTVKKYKIDLVVMGTKGAMGMGEALVGTNTVSAIFKASCPVLAIPEKARYRRISQIVFATDYRESDAEAINFLAGIAALLKAKIIVVHVAEFFVPSEYEAALLKVFEEDIRKKVNFKNITFEILRGNTSTKVINKYLKENYIDMLAVSSRKKNVFMRLFDKSFTRQMAYHTNIPLLAFQTKHTK